MSGLRLSDINKETTYLFTYSHIADTRMAKPRHFRHTDFDYVTLDVPQTFKVNGSKVKDTA